MAAFRPADWQLPGQLERIDARLRIPLRIQPPNFSMSSKFQLEIPNRLPKGLQAEALIDTDKVIAAFLEHGLEEQVKPFLEDLTADTKREPVSSWLRWEGYFVEHNQTVTLCARRKPNSAVIANRLIKSPVAF